MALSQKEIDLVLAVGPILAKFQSKKELSPTEQETAGVALGLFLSLFTLPEFSNYREYWADYLKNNFQGFLSNFPPYETENIANIIRQIIKEERKQQRIKELHQFLVGLLQGLYKERDDFGWKDIPDKYRKDFRELAYLEGLASDFQAYLEIRQEAGLPPEKEVEASQAEIPPSGTAPPPQAEIPPEGAATAVVPTSVITANVKLFLTDKEAQDEINRQIDEKLAKENEATRALIKRLVALQIVRRTALEIAKNASQQDSQTLAKINQEAGPKPEEAPEPLIQAISEELINLIIPQIEAAQKISVIPEQKRETVKNLTDIIVASAAIGDIDSNKPPLRLDLTQPAIRDEVIQVALAETIPEFQSPVADLQRQIETKVIQFTPTPRYDLPAQVQVTPQVAVSNLETITPPIITAPPVTFQIPLPVVDRVEKAQDLADKFAIAVILNPKTELIMQSLAKVVTKNQELQLTQILIGANLLTRAAPTQGGAAAARVVEKLDPVNPLITPVAIRLVSMGMDLKKIEKEVEKKPTSKLAQFFKKNPKIKEHLDRSSHHLENPKNQLGLEISPRLRQQAATSGALPPHLPPPPRSEAEIPRTSKIPSIPTGPAGPHPSPPGPLSKIATTYQNVTNRISGFLPGRAGQILNVAAHPIQFIQSKIGNFIGDRIAGQFKHWLAEKVISRIANETLKKGAEFILKKGLQEGIKLLVKEGVKRGLQIAAGATGVGLIVAAAIEVGSWLIDPLIGLAKKTIDGIAIAFTGEKLNAKSLAGTFIAAPLLFAGAAATALAGIGVATAAAATSAAIIIIGSTFIGSILYITVIAVAPIISSIAHLEAASGVPTQFVVGGVVPEGCPSDWPTASGRVTQGARTTSTHRAVEAIDIGVGLGTPIMATHNGRASYVPGGENNVYGNFVDVSSTCEYQGQKIAYTTRYAHMINGAFSGEKLVQKGEVIGYVDSTGNSTGNHLHYEIRGGNLGDINQYLPKFVKPGCIDYGNCQVNLP